MAEGQQNYHLHCKSSTRPLSLYCSVDVRMRGGDTSDTFLNRYTKVMHGPYYKIFFIQMATSEKQLFLNGAWKRVKDVKKNRA